MQIDLGEKRRNAPCPCGSGKKFKKCCIDKPSVPADKMDVVEELNGMIEEGYELIDQNHEGGACALWLKAWDLLKSKITPGIKTVEETEDLFEGNLELFEWVQDLEMGLANAAIDDPLFHVKRIRYCREFIQLFSGNVDMVKQMKLAIPDSLFRLGKKAEAEQEYKLIVAEYPKYPWGYIHWGDFYAGDDNKKAEQLYRKALGLDKNEDRAIQERIRDLL